MQDWTLHAGRRARYASGDTARGSARGHTRDNDGNERESTHETLPGETQDATNETMVVKAVGERVIEGVRDPPTRKWL